MSGHALSRDLRFQQFQNNVYTTPNDPLTKDEHISVPNAKAHDDWIGALGILAVAMILISGIYTVARYLL